MRAIAVASCIGIGLVLQGCGGGRGDKKSACSVEKVDVVSQSISGSIEISMDPSYGNTTVTTTHFWLKKFADSKFVEMFDLEEFNLRMDMFNIIERKVNKTWLAFENTTQIVNMTSQQVIQYSSVFAEDLICNETAKACVTVGNQTIKSCVIAQFPPGTVPEIAMLRQMWQKEVKPLLQTRAVCGGNDGNYDTWKLPSIPIPESLVPDTDGLTIKNGLVSEVMQMTTDHLLHSSNTSVSGEVLNGTVVLGSTKSEVSMIITEVKAGGPSQTDMDPSQFDVKCTHVNTTVDMKSFSQSPGIARKQLLRIMEASKMSEDTVMV